MITHIGSYWIASEVVWLKLPPSMPSLQIVGLQSKLQSSILVNSIYRLRRRAWPRSATLQVQAQKSSSCQFVLSWEVLGPLPIVNQGAEAEAEVFQGGLVGQTFGKGGAKQAT